MNDKAESLDQYQYHVAIENHIGHHHWTEKLSDAYLGFTLPFYYGCPNAADYFPVESFIPIDIDDYDQCLETISKTIHNNEYEKRLNYIIKARNMVLNEYNIFSVISKEICRLHDRDAGQHTHILHSRRKIRKLHPFSSVSDLLLKSRIQLKNIFGQ